MYRYRKYCTATIRTRKKPRRFRKRAWSVKTSKINTMTHMARMKRGKARAGRAAVARGRAASENNR